MHNIKAVLLASVVLLIQVETINGQTLSSKYQKPDSVAQLYSGYSLDNRLDLVKKLIRSFEDDEMKFRAIFTWVSKNITNDYDAYLRNKAKRKKFINQPERLANWNKQFGEKVWQRLPSQKSTICTGYAYLLVEMAGIAGIKCLPIDGYGRGAFTNVNNEGIPNHTWNAAQLNGQWFFFDATWASGFSERYSHEFISEYEDAYFKTPPELFAKNHYPLDTTWLLLNQKFSLKDFLDGPLIYTAAMRNGILPQAPKKFNQTARKNQQLRFEIETEVSINPEELSLRISQGGEPRKVSVQAKNVDQLYFFEYTFAHKGKHAVHIYLNDEPLVSYEVEVTND